MHEQANIINTASTTAHVFEVLHLIDREIYLVSHGVRDISPCAMVGDTSER